MPKPSEYCWKKAIVNNLNNVAAAEAAAQQAEQQSTTSSLPVPVSTLSSFSNSAFCQPPLPPRGNVIVSRGEVSQATSDDGVINSFQNNCSSTPAYSVSKQIYPEELETEKNPPIIAATTLAELKTTEQQPGNNFPNYDTPTTSSVIINGTAPPKQNDKTDIEPRDLEDEESDQEESESRQKKPSPCFECPHCPKKFRHKSYFDYHLRSHTGERPYKCHLCPKGFLERSKLNRHLNSCHNIKVNRIYEVSDDGSVQEQQNKCPHCQKSFSRMEGLQTHVQMVHEKIRPFACSKCDKTFSGKTALKNHEKGHEGVKNVICQLCGKGFLLKKYLDLHLNTTHKREPKKHGCPQCRKEFHTEKDLRRHQLMHSNAKNYQCTMCDTAFKRKDNLNRHLKLTHLLSGEQLSGESGQSSSESPTKSDDSILVVYEKSRVPSAAAAATTGTPPPEQPVLPPPPPLPQPAPAVNQVSVIKSTHEVMMSITRGQQQFL